MSDALEPPAKRQRLDLDAPSNGASSVDVPSSPVDDMDDDFYEPDPVDPAPSAANPEGSSSTAAAPASAALSTLHIPGLGLLSGPSTQQDPAHDGPARPAEEADAEDGEVSDSEAFYNDDEPGQAQLAQPPYANGTAPSQGAPADATVLNAEDGELVTKAAPADQDPPNVVADQAIPSSSVDSKDNKEDDGKAEFLRAAEANKGDQNAEWQLDSEASDSSSDSSSDDDSSDDSSEEGELLDPEEQVRRLMEETLDDPGASGKARVKTTNEVDEQYEKPDITVTETTKITELGKVESVVDNLILIKGTTSGDYRVLESGSALCLANRTIVGKISETLGRVEEPRYAVGFSDAAEIETLGISKDTTIYYVDEHSTFVFTEPLRAQKHTDASNLHDEEANDVEFSDDEKEAEHKRKQKELKRSRADANREPEEKPQPKGHADAPAAAQSGYYQGGGLKYSDDEDEDLGMYKPLARPDHFEDIVGAGAPIEDRSHVRRGMMRGARGAWMDRGGRGFRGRGGGRDRGGRFGRGQQEKRGRHNDRQRNGPHQENRSGGSGASASPGRSNRGRQQPQHSPARGNASNNRRQNNNNNNNSSNNNNNNKHASPAPTGPRSQRAGSANANAYAQNSTASSSNWAASYPSTTPAATSNAPAAAPAAPAASYGFQQPAAASAPPQDQTQNALAWMQWFQSAAAMMAQNQGQAPAPGQAPPPVQYQAPAAAQPQAQPQGQYQQYQQYQQQYSAAPNANTQQNNTQGGNASLQDILRALGGGSGA
ncbi:NAF1-domain-containing protein [Corynespora cassiicola Philippines]|uniref:H/ACA ribonucleoprotein complex non-core subunit NAF1 n=1 Tax=Corynespora cassiicola Philippines TaxID=1448308 RepID=A0A2T2NG23_CORCC|nr:NAF1-domain-containing protein [Corynespora cassiicola Philippines]